MNATLEQLQQAKQFVLAGEMNFAKGLLYGAGMSPVEFRKFVENCTAPVSIAVAEPEPEPVAQSVTEPAAITVACAEKFVKMGAHIYVTPRGTKACKEPQWEQKATNDLPTALRLAEKHPTDNLMLVGKRDGIWALDDDSGLVVEYEQKYGPLKTYTTRTVSGGRHFIFRQNDASWQMGNVSVTDENKRELLSARVDNRYVIAAGSWACPNNDTTKPLTQYTAIDPTAKFEEAPESLLSFIKAKDAEWKDKKNRNTPTDAAQVREVHEGGRNNYLTSRGGKLRDAGASYESILLELTRINQSDCVPPLPSAEVESVARSVAKYKEGTPPLALNQGSKPLTVPEGVAPIAEETTDPIPPFDAGVVNGIYKKFVEVATRGTTMTPQFVFAIAKTVVGARMAGKIQFENLDVEPRFYTALIGETGSGKGEAWRRVFQVLNCEAQIGNVSKLKIINSADSGAGIRDAFFEPPEDASMLMYIDEVESFGNKAAATRNPAIMDMLIELADSTHISSVKASRGKAKGAKTKNDARLCAVMCGQEGSVYMKAFAGRTKLGLWDRLTPEYGVAVEAGDLPHISTADAFQLLTELNKLDYSGVMTMSENAKTRLETFWSEQPGPVRKKARWKKNLTLDAYMSAFGRGVKVAELEDVEIAIRIFTRQLVIRQTHFTSEVPDRVGYYLGLIKAITEKMQRQLAAGLPEWQVAKSRRDYEKVTHAHRDNETHIFERAWAVHAPTWLRKVEVKKPNGQTYGKYLPVLEDE